MSEPKPASLHATAIAINGRGVLIVGASGTGKSDLALRLIDRGAALIADDMVLMQVTDGRLFAFAPAAANGRLHVRGIGIVQLLVAPEPVPMALAIRLGRGGGEGSSPAGRYGPVLGLLLPEVNLAPFEASAPLKLALALDRWGL